MRICSIIILTVALIPAFAAGKSRMDASAQAGLEAESLTQLLIAQSSRYRQVGRSEKTQLLKDLVGTAAARRRMLAELIEGSTADVLRLALPADITSDMPAEAREFLEEPLEVEGDLQVLSVDHNDPGQSHYVYLLKTDTGLRYSFNFAHQPPGLLSGVRVRAEGLVFRGIRTRDAGEIDGAMVLESEASILTLAANGGAKGGSNGGSPAPVPSTLGEQKTVVILVNFQDQPAEPYTITEARNAVFGTANDFFLENSYGQTWLSGDVAGWFTIALSGTVCDFDTLASQADNAAQAAGVNLSAYRRIVYTFQNACGGKGLGTIGGNPSRAWIIGSLDPGVIAHELGHGLGLYHARSLDCGTTTLGANCTDFAYGDPFDDMGNTNAGHFSAFQKERLNWLNYNVLPPITTVTASGTYTLTQLETNATTPKALKILKSTDPSTGQRTWYYLELRRAIGFDGFLAGYPNVLSGVLVHTGSESSGDSSYLLDMTPASGLLNVSDWSDPALAVGQSFEDPDAGVTLAVNWVNDTEAAVTVLLKPGSIDVPMVTVTPDQPSYSPGQTVSLTAKMTSGGSPVANASVTFIVKKSNGNVVTGTATTGSNGLAVYKLRLRNQDPVGVYQVGATAVKNGVSGSAATTFIVN